MNSQARQRYLPGQPHQLPRHNQPMAGYQPEHFLLSVHAGVATVSLNRPERKNPLSFDSYAELRDFSAHWPTRATSTRWSSRVKAATSARAGMCTRSSGR